MNDCELSGVATAKVIDADKQQKPNTRVQVAMDTAEATTIGDIQKLIFAGAAYIRIHPLTLSVPALFLVTMREVPQRLASPSDETPTKNK